MRFELTEHFCPTVFKTAALNQTQPHFHCLVPPEGFEPSLADYLSLTPYKGAVLPLNYRGEIGGSTETRTRNEGLKVPCDNQFHHGPIQGPRPCYAAITSFRRSAAYDAANALGLTIGTTLHTPRM